MDVDVGRRKTPDGPVVAEWYPRVFVTNLTLAIAIDPGEVEVGGEDGAEEEAEDAHVEPALDQTESLHKRMGRSAGLLLERVTAPQRQRVAPGNRGSQGFCSSVQPRPPRSGD